MRITHIISKTVTTSVLCLSAVFAFGQQQATSLDDLLRLVEEARLNET